MEGKVMHQYTLYSSLMGKAVFITGGGSGIGACLVEAFHRQGAKVGFVDVDASSSSNLLSRLHSQSEESIWYREADIADIDLLQECISEFSATAGGLDVLINNVANDARQDTLELAPCEWRNGLAINLDAAFFATQAALKVMRTQREGVILFMSSINALSGMTPSVPAYVTAKAGLLGLSKSLSREFGDFNIRSNAILPGWVATERQLGTWLTPEVEKDFLNKVALKRRLQPQAIASTALFLASKDADMITGQQFIVDGGCI
ncbi:SDR family oxidoreductase [Parvularcula flava]|uniref:3-oxoacyl-ACP reductase n=1 Tax=Aquisalinus luteolus TaxID=1566827 RepID=A0A8J3A052_9PROT|nr:SDR family oxidoreductase [Aquisalinus luteolus]NHK26387.1 SDR family oxidoreductase [Aquisalinus luteolus]GGH92181.1 3-oxoacyl-ACP reductase [Aquisalinus luteolus]